MTRVIRFVVHNWPLKVGAVALASLLYGGLVLSQATDTIQVNVPIDIANAPTDAIVLSNPGSVTSVRFVAPPDLGLRIDSSTFEASIDLSDVTPTGGSVPLEITVESVDPSVQVLDFEPRSIVVTVDRVSSKQVPIRAVLQPLPSGLEAGEPTVELPAATVRGPQSLVDQVAEVHARVTIDASGIDINQLIPLEPVDARGVSLPDSSRVDVEPFQARVRVPVFSDRRSKTLPVAPNVVGTPAAGFQIFSVEVDPPVVSVEGDANDLASLGRADTDSVSVSNASSMVTQLVSLDLPDGVQALGVGTVQVTVRLRPVTATRVFEAGLVLVGSRADRNYTLSTDRILVTIGGSVADLDRLSGAALVLTVDVTGLDVGTHPVPVSSNLTTGLTLISASPNPVNVTVSSPAPTTEPTAAASPGP